MDELDLDAVRRRMRYAKNAADNVADLGRRAREADLMVAREAILETAADVPALIAEVKRLRAVVALHRLADPDQIGLVPFCRECGKTWPCPTARAAGVEL